MNKEISMVIRSLSERAKECAKSTCDTESKEFHQNMMKLEARRLLELLGSEEEIYQDKLRESIRNFATTATSIFDTLRTEAKFAEEIYKKTKKRGF